MNNVFKKWKGPRVEEYTREDYVVVNGEVLKKYPLAKVHIDTAILQNEPFDSELNMWLSTNERGEWIKNNVYDVHGVNQYDYGRHMTTVYILGYMSEKQYTFFLTKYEATENLTYAT